MRSIFDTHCSRWGCSHQATHKDVIGWWCSCHFRNVGGTPCPADQELQARLNREEAEFSTRLAL